MYEIKKYEIVRTPSQLKRLKSKLLQVEEWAFDTETNTLRVNGPNLDFKLVGISISWGKYNNYYIPTGHVFDEDQLLMSEVIRELKPVFEREDITLVGWNLKYDLHVLNRIGIEVKTKKFFDGMIASWICNENESKSLKENSIRHLNIQQTKFGNVLETVTAEEKKSVGLKANNKPTFDLVRIENGSKYALDDAYYTWELYLKYLDLLEEEDMEKIFYKVYMPYIGTVLEKEKRGVSIDLDKLYSMKEEMEEDLEVLQYEIFNLAGIEFKPTSNQQLAELLFGFEDPEIYKNPNREILDVAFNFSIVSSTAKGAPQTSTDVIEELAKKEFKTKRKAEGVELCKKLLGFKKIQKLKTSFIEGILKEMYDDNKVHPSFNIVGTDSGRLSCSSPNLQQIPNSQEETEGIYELVSKYKIRDMFIGVQNPNYCHKRDKIIAVDKLYIVHFKPSELLEIPKAV